MLRLNVLAQFKTGVLGSPVQSQKYKTDSPDKVVVDIGTGYYMEKSSKNADRKVKFVTENIMILTNINII